MKDKYIGIYDWCFNIYFFIGQFFMIFFLLTKISKEFALISEFIPKFLVILSLLLVGISIFVLGFQRDKLLIYILLFLLSLGYIFIRTVKSPEYIGYDWTPIYFCSFYIGYSKTNNHLFTREFIFKNFLFILVIMLGLSGIIPNEPIYRWKEDTARYALGFSSPNTLGVIFLSIVLSTVFLINKFIYKKTIVFFLFLSAVVVYFVTYSRTSITVSVIAIVYLFVTEVLDIKISFNKSTIIFLLVSIFFVGVGLPFVNNILDDGFTIINKLLSGRLEMSTHFINEYGLSFFGKSIPENSAIEISYGHFNKIENWVLDNGYIRVLLNQGLIFLMIYLFFIYKRIFKIHKFSNSSNYIVVIMLVLLYGIFERYTFNIFIFPQLLLLSLDSEEELLKL